MKLYCLAVLHKESGGGARQLKAAYELASFGFFQRGTMQEFMSFAAKTIVERAVRPSRSTVKEQEYMVHCYVRQDGLSAILIADAEYPQRVAFTLLSKVLDDFSERVPTTQWQSATASQQIQYKGLEESLRYFQDPKQADSMTRVQDEIDETKIVLHNTIQAVLDRGEKLDDLIEKSEGLSMQSKMFYTQARKMNRCCSWY